MDAKIGINKNEVSNADAYGTHSKEIHIGHIGNMLNEASNPNDEHIKPKVSNRINNTRDDWDKDFFFFLSVLTLNLYFGK